MHMSSSRSRARVPHRRSIPGSVDLADKAPTASLLALLGFDRCIIGRLYPRRDAVGSSCIRTIARCPPSRVYASGTTLHSEWRGVPPPSRTPRPEPSAPLSQRSFVSSGAGSSPRLKLNTRMSLWAFARRVSWRVLKVDCALRDLPQNCDQAGTP